MERKFKFAPGEFYHIYSRGVEKRDIFMNTPDYTRFINLLFFANSEKPVDYGEISDLPWEFYDRGEIQTSIGCYCLMPNHFHLLLWEKNENGISRFVAKLLTAYSMYFNKKYQRSGRLFQSTFRATYVDDDEYLKYLFSYIHLNPVKLIESGWKEKQISDLSAVENYLKKYNYSSYQDFLGIEREEALILDRQNFPEYFQTSLEFKTCLNDWLTFSQ